MLVKRNPSVPLQEEFTTARRAVINVCIVLICDVCPRCSNDVFPFFLCTSSKHFLKKFDVKLHLP